MLYIADIKGSFDGKVYCEMNNEEKENFLKLYNKLKEIENILIVKNIAKKSNSDFSNFISKTVDDFNDKNKDCSFDDNLLNIGMELILKVIMLSRVFTENTVVNMEHNFEKNSTEFKGFEKISKSYYAELLRILRNYAFHYKLPITTGARTYDVLKETYTKLTFYIEKNELLQSDFFTKYQISIINKCTKEKLIFNEYISEWSAIIDKMYNYYIKAISVVIFNEYEKFYNSFNKYIMNAGAQVTEINEDGTYHKYIINKELYKEFEKIIISK